MAKSPESNSASNGGRLPVLKTFKMYVGGKFPRTESGRYYSPEVDNQPLGNICLASRKDVRNAVVSARGAQAGWANRTAYNRGQVLYRIGEMLEGRSSQFVEELVKQGLSNGQAHAEVTGAIDRIIYYAGWCDKYQQLFSCVNPVASSHFNFSVLEPTGVVFLVASESSPLLGLVSVVAPVIASGNSCVVLASESKPLSSITFAEALQTSDVPGGVVNILTGKVNELAEHFSGHLDVNAVGFDRDDSELFTSIQEQSVSNIKRVKELALDWTNDDSQSPWLIHDFCEVKTTWHPVEHIGPSGSGY